MARYEDVINSFMQDQGGRPDGAPRMPQVPDGPMSPSQPESPVSPGLQTGVNGRPAGPGGPPMPMAPQMPDIPEPPNTSSPEEVQNVEAQKQPDRNMNVLLLNRIPSRADLLDLPPGITVRTPYGDLDQDGNIAVTPEYEQKHKEAIARARMKFGPHPWAGMAGAPEMEMKLGGGFFNPFTNQFGRAE